MFLVLIPQQCNIQGAFFTVHFFLAEHTMAVKAKVVALRLTEAELGVVAMMDSEVPLEVCRKGNFSFSDLNPNICSGFKLEILFIF